MSAPLSLVLFFGVAAAWALAAQWLRRPVPLPYLAILALAPVLFLLPAFVTTRTIFPVDHARAFPPWSAGARGAPANPNLNDAATEMAPWAKAVRLAWKEGSLPWRNRWNACGSPLAANGQSAAFSPLTILMGLLPLVATFNFLAAVKLFTALCGTWVWLRELAVGAGAALFGAILFAFSFTMVPWLLHPHTAVIALWPWALFAIERLRDRDVRGRATLFLSGVWVLQILAGHPESLALGVLLAAAWLAARLALRNVPNPLPIFGRAAAAGVLALGLCAFLLLPQWNAIRDSNRLVNAIAFSNALPVRLAPHGPAWPWGLFPLVLPRSLGDAIATPMLPVAAGSFPEMALSHFGLVGLFGALLVLRPGSKRSRAEVALLAPLGLGLATAILLWPVFDLFFVMPAIRLMLPLRFFTWVAFAGSAVAAFEIDRLARDAREGGAGVAALLAAAGLLGIVGALLVKLHRLHDAAGAVPAQRRAALGAAAFLVLAAIIVAAALRTRSARSIRALPFALAVIAGCELSWQGRRLYRLGSRGDFYPPTPLVEFLRGRPKPFRVVGEFGAVYPSTNVFAEVEDIRTHDPVERRDYVEWLNRQCGYDPAAYFKHIANLDCAALDVLNVRYLVAGPDRAAPGARWRRVYSGRDGVVFENETARPRVFPTVARSASVGDYAETVNSARFRADVAADRVLLVASLVQDGGWSARDETGADLPVSRVDGPFLGVTVPRGRHRVTLSYCPPGGRAGAALSALALAGAVAAVFVSGRRSTTAGL